MKDEYKKVFLNWFKNNKFYLIKNDNILDKDLEEKFNKEIVKFLHEDYFDTIIKNREEEKEGWEGFYINKEMKIYYSNEYILIEKERKRVKGKNKTIYNLIGNKIATLEDIENILNNL